jgi:hypothetical protein
VVRALADLTKEEADALLERLGHSPAARPETLAPIELAGLFRAVKRL